MAPATVAEYHLSNPTQLATCETEFETQPALQTNMAPN